MKHATMESTGYVMKSADSMVSVDSMVREAGTGVASSVVGGEREKKRARRQPDREEKKRRKKGGYTRMRRSLKDLRVEFLSGRRAGHGSL